MYVRDWHSPLLTIVRCVTRAPSCCYNAPKYFRASAHILVSLCKFFLNNIYLGYLAH